MKLSDIQRRCIIEATIAPLEGFSRGYARTKMGPFFYVNTIHALLKTGALRRVWSGNRFLITARSA